MWVSRTIYGESNDTQGVTWSIPALLRLIGQVR